MSNVISWQITLVFGSDSARAEALPDVLETLSEHVAPSECIVGGENELFMPSVTGSSYSATTLLTHLSMLEEKYGLTVEVLTTRDGEQTKSILKDGVLSVYKPTTVWNLVNNIRLSTENLPL